MDWGSRDATPFSFITQPTPSTHRLISRVTPLIYLDMDQIIIDFLYYPHEQNIPCDEFVAAQGRWLDEEDYEWLD